MTRHTVKQLAKVSGVSVRALHHYDEIGLLKPAFLGENRYRYYGKEELLRLQQILLHRELGIPLREIAHILDRPGFDRLGALTEQRARLEAEAKRYRQLLRTIDRTIAELKGDCAMKSADLYKGFSPEKQEEYEAWLVERYGGDMRAHIDYSKAKLKSMSKVDQDARTAEMAELETALADALRHKVDANSAALEPLIARHRDWVGFMWSRPCSPKAYAGLADLYLSHPDFKARYEGIEPGFAEYLATAMRAHADRQSQ